MCLKVSPWIITQGFIPVFEGGFTDDLVGDRPGGIQDLLCFPGIGQKRKNKARKY
jgi:hypothetical protein